MRKRSLVIGTLIFCGVCLQGCLVGHCGYEKELHMIMIIPVIIFFGWLALEAGNFNFGGSIPKATYFQSSRVKGKKPKGESRPRLSGGDKHGLEVGDE